MNLTIISPTHTHTYTVQWCEIETPVGNFVIQKGHAPTILAFIHFSYTGKNKKQSTIEG
jgi:F0F1-type ATP synthase epsilon subunit